MPETEFSLDTQNVEIGCEGGIAEVGYTISNPIDGVILEYKFTADWIDGIDILSDGKIQIEVSVNPDRDSREADIHFYYGDKASKLKLVQKGSDEEPEDVTFEVDIKSTTQASVTFDVKPSDKKITYTVLTLPEEESSQYSDEELFDMIVEYYITVAGDSGMTLEDFLAANRLLVEGNIYSAVIAGLEADTKYDLITVGMTAKGNRLSLPSRTEFETEQIQMLDVTFDLNFEIDGPDIKMHIKPSDNEVPYFSGTITKKDFEDMAVTIEQVAKDNLDLYVAFLTGMGGMTLEEALAKLLVKGEYTFDANLKAETEYIGYSVAVNEYANICSAVSDKEFTTGAASVSENNISISLSYINVDRVHYSISTTNEDEYYFAIKETEKFAGKTDAQILDSLSKVVYFFDLYSGDQEGVWEYLESGKEYSAFLFGYSGGVATTSLVRKDFTTLSHPEDPTTFTFESFCEEITYSSATVTIVGEPISVKYYWDICFAALTEDEVRNALDEYLDELFATSEFYTDRKTFFTINGSRHVSSNSYDNLLEGTAYKPFVVAIDENTWEYATDFVFGETFTTQERIVSDATVTLKWDKYFDIDALADEFGGDYETFRGQNRYYLRTDVVTSGDVKATYTAALTGDLTDESSVSDAMLIKDLVDNKLGLTDSICEFALKYDTDVTLVSVALDKEGNYSVVYRQKVNLPRDGASDISEFEPVSAPAMISRAVSTSARVVFKNIFNPVGGKVFSSQVYTRVKDLHTTKIVPAMSEDKVGSGFRHMCMR